MNKDEQRKYNREYRNAHLEQSRNRCNKWGATHLENHRERDKKWREAHKEEKRIANIKWRAEHPELKNIIDENRRAKKRKVGGVITKKEWDDVLEKYDYKCLCCGRTKIKLTLDHIVPLDPGTHTLDNVQPLCMSCNSKKGRKTIDYRPTIKADTQGQNAIRSGGRGLLINAEV
jgi:5-methylcytosine-specific restriction endonuclease McrA